MTVSQIRSVLEPVLGDREGLPAEWDSRLAAYLELLGERNRRVNLVSRAAAERMIESQLLPSLAALLVVPAHADLRVLDVGSGGGFPGIPLAVLCPGIRMDLVEATGKKCEFLREAVRELALERTAVHWCRAEAPSPELLERAPFDVLVARAVGSPKVLRSAAAQLLTPEGTAWSYVPPGENGQDLPWPANGPGPAVTALRRLI